MAKNLDFLALQETKLEVITDPLVHSLWGSADCGWTFLPTEGNSGGILSVWNKVKASLVFTFTGVGFVGVCLDLIGESRRCFIINVYAKCNLRDKRSLWGNLLMSKGGFGDGLWCVLGDFNSVRDSLERRGWGRVRMVANLMKWLLLILFCIIWEWWICLLLGDPLLGSTLMVYRCVGYPECLGSRKRCVGSLSFGVAI
jgi:hypothetical protein